MLSEQRCARVELGGVRVVAEEHRLAIGRHVITELVAVSDDAREDFSMASSRHLSADHEERRLDACARELV